MATKYLITLKRARQLSKIDGTVLVDDIMTDRDRRTPEQLRKRLNSQGGWANAVSQGPQAVRSYLLRKKGLMN